VKDVEVWVGLGEVADEPVDQSGPPAHGDFTYIDIGCVDRERKVISAPQILAAESAPSRARQRLQVGDVLVSMTRPNLNAVAIVPDSLNGAIGTTGFHVLRSRWMQAKYLYFLVQSQEFVDAMCSVVQGALYPAVRPGDIGAFMLRVPPLPEQNRIVDKLEELLSDLDVAVAELKAAQTKLAQYRQSLLKAAVEGQLTADWRGRNGEPEESGARLLERILRERRTRWEARELAKFKEEGRESPIGWRTKYVEPAPVSENGLPRLPKGWVWARSEQLCEFITKGTTPPKGQANEEPRSVPFLRVTNLRSDGGLDLEDRVYVSEAVHRGFLARSVVYPGDVLMNIVGPPLGQVSLVPPTFSEWNINQAIAIFRAVEGVSSRFLVNYLLSATAQAWLGARAKTTAGQTNLTLEVCRDLPIALPPYKEQVEAVDRASAALALVVEQQASIAVALRQAAAQRKNILQAAFSGKLVPQDPNDAPASVLLERIRAERAAQGGADKRRRSPTTKLKAAA
jgi:type I restriction enzyme S subunit